MGDLPCYVHHDSADVWAHPDLFYLDEAGCPTVVAGVPPDYFSATGQLWGNPLYRWDVMEKLGFRYERDFDFAGLLHRFYRLVNGEWKGYDGGDLFGGET